MDSAILTPPSAPAKFPPFKPPRARFVILSTPRSGTTLLSDMLQTHPDIMAHGEIFHRVVDWNIRIPFRKRFDVSLRDTDPVAFVDLVLSFAGRRKAVGFKMWRAHSAAACDHVLARTDVVKVILERPNILALLASAEQARQSGVWHARVATTTELPPPAAPVRFDPEALRQLMQQTRRLYRFYRAQARGTVVELRYPAIANGDLSAVMQALGMPDLKLQPQTYRLQAKETLARFAPEDHGLIRATLAELGHPRWARPEA